MDRDIFKVIIDEAFTKHKIKAEIAETITKDGSYLIKILEKDDYMVLLEFKITIDEKNQMRIYSHDFTFNTSEYQTDGVVNLYHSDSIPTMCSIINTRIDNYISGIMEGVDGIELSLLPPKFT